MRKALFVAAVFVAACTNSVSGSGSGACSADCDARAIVEGGQVNPHGIAVAKDNVYWGTRPQGGNPNLLRRVASTGGQVSDVANDSGRFELASNGDAVFYVKARDIVRLDAGATTPTILVPRVTGGEVRSIAASKTHVYWTDGSKIMRVAASGGASEEIFAAPVIQRIEVEDATVYYSGGINNTLQGVAIDAPLPKTPRTLAAQADGMIFTIWNGTAYFASQREHTIKSVPVSGGTPAQIAETGEEPLTIAVDDTGIYFGTPKGLYRLAGGAESRVGPVDTQSHMVLDIAFDATHVYWIDYSYQALFRAGK